MWTQSCSPMHNASFGTPVDLLILPDHYVVRMLYSQGISMESIGVPRLDGGPVEKDHRKIWQLFADNFLSVSGERPSGVWLTEELHSLFGIKEKLNGKNARKIYDQIEAHLARPEFRPRALFERFNIEALCTTDAATDPLSHHQAIRKSGWKGRVIPTFRPDGVINILTPGWKENIQRLSDVSGIAVDSYPKFIAALENRRAFFKKMGAKATDHSALTPHTEELSDEEARDDLRRCPERTGFPGGRGPVHRPHAHGKRPHEHRGWAGDADPSRVRFGTTIRISSISSARIGDAIFRFKPSTRAT